MTGQRTSARSILVSDRSKYWGEKNLTYPCVIFYFVNLIVILQRDKNESTCVMVLHDWRVKCLTGQVAILAGHCSLTGRYFESSFTELATVKRLKS